ncbi:MAG: hypothetical protein H6711_27255 [Myxococcales bacterium]|nr:hypothetical protein [Myxococcales bacterium]
MLSTRGESGTRVRGARKDREEAAFRLLRAGRHGEAAREFEVLWDDFGDPRDLYNAAMSRLALGHFAHAAVYLERYLTSEQLAADARADVRGQLAEARGHLVSVRIIIDGDANGVGLGVEHMPSLASDLRPPLPLLPTLVEGGGEAAVELDPGTWQVVAVRGDVAFRETVTLRPGAPVELHVAAPPRPAEEAVPRPLLVGLGVAGSGVAAVGVGFTIVGARRADRTLHGECSESAALCGERLFRALNTRTWGIALAGAGGGAAAAGLTGLIRDRRSRRLAWIGEIAAGSSLAVLGVVSLAIADRLSAAGPPLPSTTAGWTSWAQRYDELGASNGASLHAGGGFMLGLGAGLAGGALVGLLGQRRRAPAKRSAKLEVAPVGAGLGLVGAF